MREPLYIEIVPASAEQDSLPRQDVEGARASCLDPHPEIDVLTDLADAEERGQWTRAARLRRWILSGRHQRSLPYPAL